MTKNNNAIEALDRMQTIIENKTDGGDYKDYETIRKALTEQPSVDVGDLKDMVGRPVIIDPEYKVKAAHKKGWDDCINHLHAQGYLRTEQTEEDRKKLLNLIMRDITELDYECHPDKEDAVNLIYDDLWKVIKASIERAKE